jgi:hypothetical protein
MLNLFMTSSETLIFTLRSREADPNSKGSDGFLVEPRAKGGYRKSFQVAIVLHRYENGRSKMNKLEWG